MKTRPVFLLGMALALPAFGVDLLDIAVPPEFLHRRADTNGPLKGVVEWKDRNRPDASDWDRTDYWAAIAVSPATRKYAASCEYLAFDTASRVARDKCNAPDARTVVLCGNGWCALALGEPKDAKDFTWGAGWGPDQAAAEKFALEGARDQGAVRPRVVFSINSREPHSGGAIAYSESTGRWGYSSGGGRRAPYMALQNCKAPDAKVIAQGSDGWLALALGDDRKAYGWASAGNRTDAERDALTECAKRTKNAKVVCVFCTNGVMH